MSLRAEVVATAREMFALGLVAGAAGNVSARNGDVVHITPRALPYEEMTEADVVGVSLEGEVIEGEASVERVASPYRHLRRAARSWRGRSHP